MEYLNYVLLGVYMLGIMLFAYYISKKQNEEDFMIAGRNRSWFSLSFSKFAGAVSATWFVTYTAYAYEFGLGMFSVLFGFIVGYFVFGFVGAQKLYDIAKEKRFYIIDDFILYKTKSKVAKIIGNIFTIIVLFIWILTGVVAGSKILEHFGMFSYEISLGITLIFVLIYILFSGYRGVILTDIVQGIIILVLLGFITFNLVINESVFEILNVSTNSMSFLDLVGFFLYGCLSFFAMADRYQLLYSAKSKNHFAWGVGVASIPLFVSAFFLLIIGLYVKSQGIVVEPSLVFLEAIGNYMSPTFIGIAMILFFAGLMSTVDTNIYAVSSHLSMFKTKRNKMKNVKLYSFFLIFIVFLTGLLFRNIIDLTIIAAASTLILSFPMLYLFFGNSKSQNKSSSRFFFSTLFGMLGLFLGIFFFGMTPTLALTVLIGGIVGLGVRSKRLEKYFYFLEN